MTNEEIIAILSGMGNQRENAHSNIDSLISNNNNENEDFFELADKEQQNPLDFIMQMLQGGTTNPNEMPNFLKNMIPSMNTQPQKDPRVESILNTHIGNLFKDNI